MQLDQVAIVIKKTTYSDKKKKLFKPAHKTTEINNLNEILHRIYSKRIEKEINNSRYQFKYVSNFFSRVKRHI